MADASCHRSWIFRCSMFYIFYCVCAGPWPLRWPFQQGQSESSLPLALSYECGLTMLVFGGFQTRAGVSTCTSRLCCIFALFPSFACLFFFRSSYVFLLFYFAFSYLVLGLDGPLRVPDFFFLFRLRVVVEPDYSSSSIWDCGPFDTVC